VQEPGAQPQKKSKTRSAGRKGKGKKSPIHSGSKVMVEVLDESAPAELSASPAVSPVASPAASPVTPDQYKFSEQVSDSEALEPTADESPQVPPRSLEQAMMSEEEEQPQSSQVLAEFTCPHCE
jgi:hypothetical protein